MVPKFCCALRFIARCTEFKSPIISPASSLFESLLLPSGAPASHAASNVTLTGVPTLFGDFTATSSDGEVASRLTTSAVVSSCFSSSTASSKTTAFASSTCSSTASVLSFPFTSNTTGFASSACSSTASECPYPSPLPLAYFPSHSALLPLVSALTPFHLLSSSQPLYP
eukprot:25416_1